MGLRVGLPACLCLAGGTMGAAAVPTGQERLGLARPAGGEGVLEADNEHG